MPLACSRRHLGGSEPTHRAPQVSQSFWVYIFKERLVEMAVAKPPARFHWSFLFLVNLAALSNTPNSLRPSRGCVFGTSCDLDYRPLAYPIAWHNWGCLMQSDPHSAPLFRFTLLTIYQLVFSSIFWTRFRSDTCSIGCRTVWLSS